MSKPVFDDIFALEGRRNRQSYALYFLAFNIALILYGAMAGFVGEMNPSLGMVMVLLWLPVAYSGLVVIAQRCRDFGWAGWAALIIAVPVIGVFFIIALLFIPGTSGPNRYGPDPTTHG